jgi:integrase
MTRPTKRPNVLGTVQRNRGRWRAYYERHGRTHTPGRTFSTEEAAWRWLRTEQVLIDKDEWTPPAQRRAEHAAQEAKDALTFGEFAREWIEKRITPKGTPLHRKTRGEYLRYLDGTLKPLAMTALVEITDDDVAAWHADAASTPTLRHHAYAFARSVAAAAVKAGKIESNPFDVEHAAVKPDARKDAADHVDELNPDKVAELADLVIPRDKALVLLLAYCAMRHGEALALRRSDLTHGTADGVKWRAVRITKGVSTYDGDRHESETKTGAKGKRKVPVPPHLWPVLDAHMKAYAEPGADGLIFPGTNPHKQFRTSGQVYGHAPTAGKKGRPADPGSGWYRARVVAGVPDVRLHWLRHYAATVWDQAGATHAQRQKLLGHAAKTMTDHYTTAQWNDMVRLARKVSELTGWTDPDAPAAAAPTTAPAPPALIATMAAQLDDAQLAELLPTLDDEQHDAVLDALAPGRERAIMRLLGNPRPKLTVIEGGAK